MKGDGIKRRIYDEIVVTGIPVYSVFDSGSRNCYITKSAVDRLDLDVNTLRHAYPVGLGGKKRHVRQTVQVEGTLHGLPLHLLLYVIDELAEDEDGRDIELLFGISAMEIWGVNLDVQNKRLDLTHFTKEFIEF